MNKHLMRIRCACLALSFCVCGCSKQTRGNQNLSGVSVTEIQDRIKEGKTTKHEVKEWLGEPSGISKDKDGNEVWRYSFGNYESKIRATTFIPVVGGLLGGVDTKMESRILTIVFKNERVLSFSFDTANS